MNHKYQVGTKWPVNNRGFRHGPPDILEVVEVSDDKILSNKGIWLRKEWLDKLVGEPLQVGQFVAMSESEGGLEAGTVAEIIIIDDEDNAVSYRVGRVGNLDVRSWTTLRNLEPIPEGWSPFIPGRLLEIIVDRPCGARLKIGDVVKIHSVNTETNTIEVTDPSGFPTWAIELDAQMVQWKFVLNEETENKTASGDGSTTSNEGGSMNQDSKMENVFANRDIQVARAGTKIILPNDPREMSYDEGIETLQRMKKQEAIKVDVFEEVDAFPLEGAWALNQVLKAMFGYVMQTQGFFGATSTMVTLEVGHNKKEQVVWGEFQVPGVSGKLHTGVQRKDGQLMFVITGTVLKKEQETIKKIADLTRDYVAANSLYKGKAVRINTVEDNGTYVVDFKQPPRFLDLSKVNENELTFSDDVHSLVQTNLFTPIEKTQACRDAGVPLKRSVLLEGPFGTGKTLTAFVAAKKAEQNGWTFIYLDRPQALREILIFARRYAPAVIFAEDIDRVVSGQRNQKIDDVMNNIDGLDSKGHEVLCVFTTNEIEKIEPGMLRAGRLDAVITVAPPDAKAAEKLIRIYSKGLVAETEDLTAAGKELAGTIPAFIREVVERSKLFAIGRLQEGETLKLTGEDLRICAVGMKHHISLVNPPKKDALTVGDKLALALADVLQNTEHYASEEDAKAHRITIDREARLQ